MVQQTNRGHILMLTHDRQIDRRILLQAKTLNRDNWRVTLLAMPHDQAMADKNSDYLTLIRLTEQSASSKIYSIKLLKIYHYLIKKLGYNSKLLKKVKSLLLRFFISPEKYFNNLFLETAQQIKADVYMAHDLPLLSTAYHCAQSQQAKLVYDSHELYPFQDYSKQETKLWQRIEKKYIHACQKVITINQSIAKHMQQSYALDRIHVIENVTDLTINNTSEKNRLFHRAFQLDKQAKILLYQGNLSDNRNLLNLIHISKQITDHKIHLVFLGNGPLLAQLKDLAGNATNIHFHPAVSQKELLQYTLAADVGVIPYQDTCLNNRYCTPNKLYEFIAAGIPIISSNLPELAKKIVDNQIGCVTDMSNPSLSAQTTTNFINNINQFQQAKINIARLAESLNWKNEGAKLSAIFRQLND